MTTTTDIFGPANAADSVTSRPADDRTVAAGAADSFFQNCTAPGNDDGTDVTAGWLNQITAALRALSRANGQLLGGASPVNPDNNANDGILAQSVQYLIQRGAVGSAADSGTANAATVALNPTPPEVIAGMPFLVKKIAAQNTGAMTFNGVALTWADGSALQAGDWPASTWAEVVCAAATSGGGPSAYVLLSVMGPSVFQRAAGVAQALSGNGYYIFPGTVGSRFCIQWGQITTSGGSASVTFPLAFIALYQVVATDDGAATWSNSNASFCGVGSPGNTGFTARSTTWNGSTCSTGGSNANQSWIATGKI